MKRYICVIVSLVLLGTMPFHSNFVASLLKGGGISGPAETTPAVVEPEYKNDEEAVMNMQVGDKAFIVKIYNNPSAQALLQRLPLTLDMSEMNGNEKYYNLDHPLPANASRPIDIHKGNLMLYGSDCLVVFYESFSSSYSYTPLGYIEDTKGLAEALGSGSIQVTFAHAITG